MAQSTTSAAIIGNVATAADRVLSIVELLENILIHVDYESLLECNKVNKTFRATIAASTHLTAYMMLDITRVDKTFSCPLYDDEAMARILHPFAIVISGPIVGTRKGICWSSLLDLLGPRADRSVSSDRSLEIYLAEDMDNDWVELGCRRSLKDNEDLDTTPCTRLGDWRGVSIRNLRAVEFPCQADDHLHTLLASEKHDITLGEATDFAIDTLRKCWARQCGE